jgi:hypothetical protein
VAQIVWKTKSFHAPVAVPITAHAILVNAFAKLALSVKRVKLKSSNALTIVWVVDNASEGVVFVKLGTEV